MAALASSGCQDQVPRGGAEMTGACFLLPGGRLHNLTWAYPPEGPTSCWESGLQRTSGRGETPHFL